MMTAAEAFMEIETRAIALTPVLRGSLWIASVDLVGERHNSRRALSSVSASARTSLAAVAALVEKLEAEQQPEIKWAA